MPKIFFIFVSFSITSSLLALSLFTPTLSLAADYNYVSIEELVEQEVGRAIIPKIYEKIGLEVTITPLPGKRAQAEATSGVKDSEIMRIFTYGENNPTVVWVPPPYYSRETMGFIQKAAI